LPPKEDGELPANGIKAYLFKKREILNRVSTDTTFSMGHTASFLLRPQKLNTNPDA
jgi:hypothetical protein